MNFKKSILILTLFFFATMQSQAQSMVTTNIQSQLLNKYWCPNVGDEYEVIFLFDYHEVTLFVGNKKIGSEPYYMTSNSEVTTPTTFDDSKVGTISTGNCIKTNSSYYIIEFFSDYQSFRWKRSFDPEGIWQTYTIKGNPYFSTQKSGTFTRNNCGDGNIGDVWDYIVEPGKHISYISQADADLKAQADVTLNGQNDANSNGSCTYYNTETTVEITKSNCSTGKVGTKVSYTVPARICMSEDEEVLDMYVSSHINTIGQVYANGKCSCVYTNLEVCRKLERNNCPSGTSNSFQGLKSLIPYSYRYCVPSGKYSSSVSQAEVDKLVQLEFETEGQMYANSQGLCEYRSNRITGTYTKQNCASGQSAPTFDFIAEEGSARSTISQQDANAKAKIELDIRGQETANSRGVCGTYTNKSVSRNYVRTNCATGGVPSTVDYVIPAGMYISTVSQAVVDAKALYEVNLTVFGQGNANYNGTCTFKNTAKSGTFTKNNCEVGGLGSAVTYIVIAGKYTSTVSQADADKKATDDLAANGQSNANSIGTCTFKSKTLTNSFRKICTSPKTGSLVPYSLAAGAYTSIISQADADDKAQLQLNNLGQTYANNNGICGTYTNTIKSGTFTKNNCDIGGFSPTTVTYVVNAGSYVSTLSQNDANAKAQADVNANGQAHANANGTCTYKNTLITRTYTKSNCLTMGSAVEYVVPAGIYFSTISQADANQKTQKDFDEKGQNNANEKGYCYFVNDGREYHLQKTNCPNGLEGTYHSVTIPSGRFTSIYSQSDANRQANNEAQDYVNSVGQCK